MFFATDLATVTHGIQLAVAPVFLLTAVAAMIGTVAGRLARIIDRARLLENQIDAAPAANPMTAAYSELGQLRVRGGLVNGSITLLTLCAILIGLTILALFLGETTEMQIFRLATVSFLSARCTNMKPPPPRLPARGIVTASVNPTATAASTALPPLFSTSTPTRLACFSCVTTMPLPAVAVCARTGAGRLLGAVDAS